MDTNTTHGDYDLFASCRREMQLDLERSTRRRRLYAKFGQDKRRAMQSNSWSVQDHQDFLMCGYSDKQKRFCILPRAVVTSPAFWTLKNSAVKTLIMSYNETDWNKPKKVSIKARAGGKGARTIALPAEPKPFILPIGRLQAVGVSRAAATTSLAELESLGFIEVLDRTAGKPVVYRVSEDYQKRGSVELGILKNSIPSEREKPFSGDSETGKAFAVAV